MGAKGQKRTVVAKEAADAVVAGLAPLGNVTARGMFGGYGIRVDGVMFGLVDRDGIFHLRADDQTRRAFEEAGGEQHGSMPYFSVPDAVLDHGSELISWSTRALEVARAAKKH